MRTADASSCGRRSARNLEIPRRTYASPKVRGLTRIINSSSALGKLTCWVQLTDAIVLTDALYPSHPRDHGPQLQPLIVLKWSSHAQMDWTHGTAAGGPCGSESESQTRGLTADPRQHLPADADLWSESAVWCGRNISGSAQLRLTSEIQWGYSPHFLDGSCSKIGVLDMLFFSDLTAYNSTTILAKSKVTIEH